MATKAHTFFGTVSSTGGFSGDGAQLTALARANVAAGTADHVLINGPTGLISSESLLSVSRGGLGAKSGAPTWASTQGIIDPLGTTTPMYAVVPGIKSGDTGVFNAVGASTSKVPSTIVMRDTNGDISGVTTVSNFSSTYVSNNTYPVTTNVYNISNTYNSGGSIVQCYQRTTSTVGERTRNLLLISATPNPYPSNTNGNIALTIKGLVAISTASSTTSAYYDFSTKAYYDHNSTWQLETPTILHETKDLDAALSAVTITLATNSDTELYIQVNQGASPTHVDWAGMIQMSFEITRTD